jgi:putative copper resistance protein D
MEESAAGMQAGFAALVNAAFACMVGTAALWQANSALRTIALARWSSVALAIALVLYLGAGTVGMTDASGSELLPAMWSVLMQSHFGAMIQLGGAACLLLALLVFVPGMTQPGKVRKVLFLFGLAVFAFSRAATGHAIDKGMFGFAVFNHTLHVLAACAWVGVAIVCALASCSWQAWDNVDRIALTQRVSAVATVALIVALGTGALNTLRTMDLGQLSLNSPYTSILAMKLAGVALAAMFGAYNRWVSMPRMQLYPGSAGRRFSRVVLAETIVLVLVLYAAATLGMTMPPL